MARIRLQRMIFQDAFARLPRWTNNHYPTP